jgi:hypothetical protein
MAAFNKRMQSGVGRSSEMKKLASIVGIFLGLLAVAISTML